MQKFHHFALTAWQDRLATAKGIAAKKEADEQQRIDLLRQKERNEKAYAAKEIAQAVQAEHSEATLIAEDTAKKSEIERRGDAAARARAEEAAQLIDKRDEDAAKKKHEEWTRAHAAVNKMKISKGQPPDIDDEFEKEMAMIRARAKAREEEARRQAEADAKAEAAEQARATLAWGSRSHVSTTDFMFLTVSAGGYRSCEGA